MPVAIVGNVTTAKKHLLAIQLRLVLIVLGARIAAVVRSVHIVLGSAIGTPFVIPAIGAILVVVVGLGLIGLTPGLNLYSTLLQSLNIS